MIRIRDAAVGYGLFLTIHYHGEKRMTLRWEELTAPEFAKAVKKTRGVCIVPMGVLEKHGPHLPLGADLLMVRAVAERAVILEPAIVFPPYYFGQIQGAKNAPGCVALSSTLLFSVLHSLCEEIARNGLHKILLLDGHGGNESFLSEFRLTLLEQPHDYMIYVIRLGDYYAPGQDDPVWKRMKETDVDGHAGETETSAMLAAYPQLVRKAAIPRQPGLPTHRLAHLPPVLTSLRWNADFPDHYAGDARYASVQKGEYLLEYQARKVAAIIKAVKRDRTVAAIQREFFRKAGEQINRRHPVRSGKY